MFRRLEPEMRQNPRYLPQMIHLLSIARMLERAADHTVNIAEDVLYLERGTISRHGKGLTSEHPGPIPTLPAPFAPEERPENDPDHGSSEPDSPTLRAF